MVAPTNFIVYHFNSALLTLHSALFPLCTLHFFYSALPPTLFNKPSYSCILFYKNTFYSTKNT